jgi:hypothetical protein
MKGEPSMDQGVGKSSAGRTIIGTFTETWDAESALEELRCIGFEGRLRYAVNDDAGIANDTRIHGGFQSYFARLHGFEDESESSDSRGHFSVNPEAEQYFAETYEKKFHVLLVQARDDMEKAFDAIRRHHGNVEVRDGSFLAAMSEDDRPLQSKAHQNPTKFHPTTVIDPPLNSTL